MDFQTLFSREFFQVVLAALHEGYTWDSVESREVEDEIILVH